MFSPYYLTPNDQVNGTYRGLAYVFDSSGGFSVDQSFPRINLNTYLPIAQYDVTDALQIRFSVRTFNNKIGVIKDQCNNEVLEVLYFDVSSETLSSDFIHISTDEFLEGITTKNIVSMGKMSTLYSDFNYTVMEYFGAPYGFSSVFENATDFNANNGLFDASAFINLINGISFNGVTGSVISDLSGWFQVNELNKHLRFCCGTNVFGNRDPEGNFGLPNGFMAGDLIYITNGINVTLKLGVEPEPYLPINNVGPINLDSVDDFINYSDQQANIHRVTTSSITDITQSYSVPILIILDNIDTFNFGNFGNFWVDTAASLGKKNWLSISISSLGQYQSAIEETGGIYISDDYGITWRKIYQMPPNYSNSIAINETGQYQTASNGLQIFISANYGLTWREVYSLGANKIYVSISLNGKYQAVLSPGDSLYSSSDFGNTWTRFNDANSDLYNSISSFPMGGISLSFTGQYQSIASEDIYVSNDYGATWIGVNKNAPFNDHNWVGIAISTTGQRQTATDSGGDIYISNDYGVTWKMIASPNVQDRLWQAIAITANGHYQTALEYGGTIYTSSDYGETWSASTDTNIANKNWQCVAMSANGQYQSIAEYGGSIYVSQLL